MNIKLASRLSARLWPRPTQKKRAGSGAAAVFRAAARIDPDPAAVMAWYCRTPIAELDELTARVLVASGRAEEVLAFLADVARGLRG